MKPSHTLNFVIATLFFSSTIFYACKKKDESPDTTNTTTGSTTSTISTPTAALVFTEGGQTITADSAKAVLYTSSDVGGPRKRKIDIYGFKNGQQIVEMHFKPQTGDQAVAQNFESAWLTYMTNNGNTYPDDYYNCSSGAFNLSMCDTTNKKIVGSFSFTGSNGTVSKNISAGALTINSIKIQN